MSTRKRPPRDFGRRLRESTSFLTDPESSEGTQVNIFGSDTWNGRSTNRVRNVPGRKYLSVVPFTFNLSVKRGNVQQ